MSEENSFFRSFFWNKYKTTHKNLKKAKKIFIRKTKRQGKHILNTSYSNPIYIYVYINIIKIDIIKNIYNEK